MPIERDQSLVVASEMWRGTEVNQRQNTSEQDGDKSHIGKVTFRVSL